MEIVEIVLEARLKVTPRQLCPLRVNFLEAAQAQATKPAATMKLTLIWAGVDEVRRKDLQIPVLIFSRHRKSS